MQSEIKCAICGIDEHKEIKDIVHYGIVWSAAGRCDVLILTRNEETKARCKKFLCHVCIKAVEMAVVTSEPVAF